MTPYTCLKSSSVVASKDAGKRCLRTHDVDGVGLAAEKSDSGHLETGLTGSRDIEVELVSRSRDRVRDEFEARHRGVHRQTRDKLAEIDIDVERRNISAPVHESDTGAIRHWGQIVVAQDQRLQRAGRASEQDRRIGSGTECGHKDRKSTRLNSSHSQISYAV